MRENYTHMTIILDRSGSMESIRDDTIGGFNTFLGQQQQESGSATLTLVQFDTENPYEVIQHFTPLVFVPKLTWESFVPRGSTPLFDALGRAINDLEESLGRLKDEEKPSKVLLVVVTDGQENSSREFRRSQIESLVKTKTEQQHWQFVFLSADLQAMTEAKDIGFKDTAMRAFEKSSLGVHAAWGVCQ